MMHKVHAIDKSSTKLLESNINVIKYDNSNERNSIMTSNLKSKVQSPKKRATNNTKSLPIELAEELSRFELTIKKHLNLSCFHLLLVGEQLLKAKYAYYSYTKITHNDDKPKGFVEWYTNCLGLSQGQAQAYMRAARAIREKSGEAPLSTAILDAASMLEISKIDVIRQFPDDCWNLGVTGVTLTAEVTGTDYANFAHTISLAKLKELLDEVRSKRGLTSTAHGSSNGKTNGTTTPNPCKKPQSSVYWEAGHIKTQYIEGKLEQYKDPRHNTHTNAKITGYNFAISGSDEDTLTSVDELKPAFCVVEEKSNFLVQIWDPKRKRWYCGDIPIDDDKQQ